MFTVLAQLFFCTAFFHFSGKVCCILVEKFLVFEYVGNIAQMYTCALR